MFHLRLFHPEWTNPAIQLQLRPQRYRVSPVFLLFHLQRLYLRPQPDLPHTAHLQPIFHGIFRHPVFLLPALFLPPAPHLHFLLSFLSQQDLPITLHIRQVHCSQEPAQAQERSKIFFSSFPSFLYHFVENSNHLFYKFRTE